MKINLLGCLTVLIMIPTISQAAPLDVYGQYPDCTAPAIPAEVHSWWKEPDEEFPRLLSTASCMPNARDENGPILPDNATFWVRSVTYNNPGDVTYVRTRMVKAWVTEK